MPAGGPFQLVDGVSVRDHAGVAEGYAVKVVPDGYSMFTVNVSAERLASVLAALFRQVAGLGFFVFETGSPRDVEERLRTKPTDPLHKDVYYLDGIETARALEILAANERNLLHDGGVNFGFGSHEGHDEVFVAPFKILHIYADAPAKYREALRALGIEERETLKTIWDCLSRDNPGRRSILEDASPTRWEMLETLKTQGLYFAEHREN